MDTQRLEDAGKLLLRILVAGLMLFHGVDKILHGPVHVVKDLADHGLPEFLSRGVYVGEILAPILILLGLWTRIAAATYAGNIAFATLLVHTGDFAKLAPTGGWAAELWVFYIVAPLAVVLLGPGRYTLRTRPFPWD